MNIFNRFIQPKYKEQSNATDDMIAMMESKKLVSPDHIQEPHVTPDLTETVKPKEAIVDALYTIGINDKGQTQLRIVNTGYGSITLTMNTVAVRQMIRQLEATI